jgi:hypothetical protein
MNESKPNRSWLRFSVRDLIWLTLLAAVLVAWWLDHRELTKQHIATLAVYSLVNIDAKTAAAAVEKIYSGDRDVQIAAETQQNRIISNAPSRQQAEILAILLKLDGGK